MAPNEYASQSDFEELTFCYLEQLFRLAYSRVGCVEDAQDILQETYLKAFRSFGSLKQRAYTKRWLTQILINTINDHQRKSRRFELTVDISDLPEEFADEQRPGPEEELCRDEIDPALIQALNSLPEIFLVPLLLREIQEASYEEIALILGIPLGTVMSRLSRARGLLRKKLAPSLGQTASIAGHKNNENLDRRGSSQ